MIKRNKTFVLALIGATLLFGALVVENYRLSLQTGIGRSVDVEKVKSKIQAAGLEPYEARHWVSID